MKVNGTIIDYIKTALEAVDKAFDIVQEDTNNNNKLFDEFQRIYEDILFLSKKLETDPKEIDKYYKLYLFYDRKHIGHYCLKTKYDRDSFENDQEFLDKLLFIKLITKDISIHTIKIEEISQDDYEYFVEEEDENNDTDFIEEDYLEFIEIDNK